MTWGEQSKVVVNIDPQKPVSYLISEGLKLSGFVGSDKGPWYLMTGSKILGPESYSVPVQTSGIMPGQIVTLTDKPMVIPETPQISGEDAKFAAREYLKAKVGAMTEFQINSVGGDEHGHVAVGGTFTKMENSFTHVFCNFGVTMLRNGTILPDETFVREQGRASQYSG